MELGRVHCETGVRSMAIGPNLISDWRSHTARPMEWPQGKWACSIKRAASKEQHQESSIIHTSRWRRVSDNGMLETNEEEGNGHVK